MKYQNITFEQVVEDTRTKKHYVIVGYDRPFVRGIPVTSHVDSDSIQLRPENLSLVRHQATNKQLRRMQALY